MKKGYGLHLIPKIQKSQPMLVPGLFVTAQL